MTTSISVTQGFVDLPGVRLAYDSAGQGDAVVFLHGGLLDRQVWDGQFTVFAQHHHVLRYDLRSAGQSETTPTTEPYTHYADLYGFLQALQIDQVTLVGHSNYGIALDFALIYPHLVRKLVIVSPGLRGYAFRDPWAGERFAALGQALSQRDLAGAVEVFLTMWVDGPQRQPDEVDHEARERLRLMVTHAFAMSRFAPNSVGIEPPAIGRLAEIQAPTLVILGDKDAPDILEIGQLIYQQINRSKLITMANVGHTLMMEKPDEFNRIVEGFLQS